MANGFLGRGAPVKLRHKIVPSVYLILEDSGSFLFGLRKNSGYFDDHWGFVAGHVESQESATAALLREVREEIGLSLTPEEVKVIQVVHRNSLDRENVEFYFYARYTGQKLVNCEPDKCADLRFIRREDFPPNTIPFQMTVLETALNGVYYQELGWPPL